MSLSILHFEKNKLGSSIGQITAFTTEFLTAANTLLAVIEIKVKPILI